VRAGGRRGRAGGRGGGGRRAGGGGRARGRCGARRAGAGVSVQHRRRLVVVGSSRLTETPVNHRSNPPPSPPPLARRSRARRRAACWRRPSPTSSSTAPSRCRSSSRTAWPPPSRTCGSTPPCRRRCSKRCGPRAPAAGPASLPPRLGTAPAARPLAARRARARAPTPKHKRTHAPKGGARARLKSYAAQATCRRTAPDRTPTSHLPTPTPTRRLGGARAAQVLRGAGDQGPRARQEGGGAGAEEAGAVQHVSDSFGVAAAPAQGCLRLGRGLPTPLAAVMCTPGARPEGGSAARPA
jgi:hypothetical protein